MELVLGAAEVSMSFQKEEALLDEWLAEGIGATRDAGAVEGVPGIDAETPGEEAGAAGPID